MQNMQSMQNLQNKPPKPNLPNQTYQTKPTKPILPNQTYQTKPFLPNLPKLLVKAVNAWVRSGFGNVFDVVPNDNGLETPQDFPQSKFPNSDPS